jgi:hypothetical protein
VVFKKTIWIFAVPAVGGPTRRLDVGDTIGFGAKHTEECFGMHRPCPDFHIVWLLDDAPSITPVFLQLKNEVLKRGAF